MTGRDELRAELHQIQRTAEMSAAIMRDTMRTGPWTGAERVARAFDRIAERLAALTAGQSGAGEGAAAADSTRLLPGLEEAERIADHWHQRYLTLLSEAKGVARHAEILALRSEGAKRVLDAIKEECGRLAYVAPPVPAADLGKRSPLEVRARQIAADKMGLVKDPTGARLPDELWKQALPAARAESATPEHEGNVVREWDLVAALSACRDELFFVHSQCGDKQSALDYSAALRMAEAALAAERGRVE